MMGGAKTNPSDQSNPSNNNSNISGGGEPSFTEKYGLANKAEPKKEEPAQDKNKSPFTYGAEEPKPSNNNEGGIATIGGGRPGRRVGRPNIGGNTGAAAGSGITYGEEPQKKVEPQKKKLPWENDDISKKYE